jgi:hypothetical protein
MVWCSSVQLMGGMEGAQITCPVFSVALPNDNLPSGNILNERIGGSKSGDKT